MSSGKTSCNSYINMAKGIACGLLVGTVIGMFLKSQNKEKSKPKAIQYIGSAFTAIGDVLESIAQITK